MHQCKVLSSAKTLKYSCFIYCNHLDCNLIYLNIAFALYDKDRKKKKAMKTLQDIILDMKL